MLYMFLLYWNESDPPAASEDVIAEHFAFAQVARERGAYVSSESVGGGSNATTVRVRDGKTLVTDGPFVETKEAMGGFYILDCKDLDEALEYAAKIPDAKYSGVEVRPVMHVPDWPYDESPSRTRQSMGGA
ncbi:MAG: YciI family protein [Dehalococcoidia bacterium]